MWKQVGVVLAVSLVGLGADRAEARFGKRSNPQSSSPPVANPSPRPPPGSGGSRPRPNPYYGNGYYGYYGYANPWVRYYYDPSWAWPYVGPGGLYQPFGRYYDLRYYDLLRRRRPTPRPNTTVEREAEDPFRVDFAADTGLVAQGLVVGLGLQVDGERFGLSGRLNMLDLAADDGSEGRDSITLLSLKPSILLVSNKSLRVRVAGGVDIAVAPDVIFVGPGVGTSALLRVMGPIELEASANYTPLPFTQLTGETGLAVELGPLRLRSGYRSIYVSDQGRVEQGRVNSELFAGPYAGLALRL